MRETLHNTFEQFRKNYQRICDRQEDMSLDNYLETEQASVV